MDFTNIFLMEIHGLILSESLAKYKVINGGVGYDSLQETTKFFLDGPQFRKLKYVISLNGINDLPDDYGPREGPEFTILF